MAVKIKRAHIDRLELILGSLVDSSLRTVDILMPLVRRYIIEQMSFRNIRARIGGDTYYLEKRARDDKERLEYRHFYDSLRYLKREGFVAEDHRSGLLFWRLTKSGHLHLKLLKTRHMRYSKEKTDKVFIVSYDIPEHSKKHRDWVRGVLKLLDFSMVHKSVWIGSSKIPEDFLRDLKTRSIFSYIQIFEVGKKGTLVKS